MENTYPQSALIIHSKCVRISDQLMIHMKREGSTTAHSEQKTTTTTKA